MNSAANSSPGRETSSRTIFLFRGKNHEFRDFMAHLTQAEEPKPLGAARIKWLMDNNIAVFAEPGTVTLIDEGEQIAVSGSDMDKALMALCDELRIGNLAHKAYVEQLKKR